MNAKDTDLIVLREVTADVAGRASEPSADAVARTWTRITMSGSAAPPSRPRFWSRGSALSRALVPAIAAVAVAVVLLATVALRPGPGKGLQVGVAPLPPTPSSSADKSPPSSPPQQAVPTVAVTDPGTTVRSVPVGRVIDEMAAKTATVSPVTLGAGQLLYLRMEVAETVDGQVQPRVCEWWIETHGMTAVKIVNDGQDMGPGYGPPPGPPSLAAPTPQWLASLSTNPAVLYSMLEDLNAGVKLGGAHYVLKELAALYRTSDPVLVPAVRAAFYRVLGEIDGLSATEVNVAGRTLYRVHQAGQNVTDLLLDPATGQVAGVRYTYLTPEGATVEAIELWYRAVVSQVGQTA